jgi:hypothetical protein
MVVVAWCWQKETSTVVKPSNRPVAAAWRNRLQAHALSVAVLASIGVPSVALAADSPEPAPEPPALAASDAASAPAQADAQGDAEAGPATPPKSAKTRRYRTAMDMDPVYGLELKQYVNRLAFLFRNEFPAVPGAIPGLSQNRPIQQTHRSIRFPRPLVVALRYDAEGKYLAFDYIERTGNFHTDTDAGRAFQRSVWLLSPPPIPPGSTGPFTVWIRFNGTDFVLAPAEE